MKLLVLGAGGIFGNNLADYSLKRGHTVWGIGRSPRKEECFTLGVKYPYYPYHIGYELDYCLEVVKKMNPDVIVNFAAQGEGAASWGKDNWRFYNTNCVALARLVANIDCPFIQIGSSEVYGSVDSPVSEDSLLNPTSPYSASKAAFDFHLVAMHKVKGLPYKIVRPSNCYAPTQALHRIIPKSLISGLYKRPIDLHGGGVAKKSYLHAYDLSAAILMVHEKGSYGHIYNVGPDNPTSIKDVVRMCLEASGGSWDELVRVGQERTGQDSCYWLDSSKIKALGWKQTIDWEEGLASMMDWLNTYPELRNYPTEFTMRA